MKYFRSAWFANPRRFVRPCCLGLLLLPAVVATGWAAAEWRNSEAGSAVESALYRLMPMPASKVLGLRPPREATPLLAELIKRQPTAELYALRAQNEEAALDFKGAEADWKKSVELASDRIQAQWQLADFYKRRLRPADEIQTLAAIGRAPIPPAEKLTAIRQQRSWLAFERIFTVISESALGADVSIQNYSAWLERYPAESSVYGRYFQFLLERKMFAEAEKLIGRYQKAMPGDEAFSVKARALLEYRRGSIEKGIAVYDGHFQPLWPQELIDSYFALMQETRSLRRYLDHARAELQRNPDDLSAAARIFYYYQRQGRTDVAQQTLSQYRLHKDQRNAKWSSQELYTLARLSEGIKSYAEAARYYYALYNTNDRPDAAELALAGLINVLLDAPEQNVAFGSSSLSMYRDIATMDRGPGYLNGILSLLMNSSSPAYAYSEEEQRAIPYFHRAEAAQLIGMFEGRFPNSKQRPALRLRLMEALATYGEHDAVIRQGQQFLTAFPQAVERERVAMRLADAYAAKNNNQEEFALYDSELAELARRSDGVPLLMKSSENAADASSVPEINEAAAVAGGEGEEGSGGVVPERVPASPEQSRAFSMQPSAPPARVKSAAAWYSDFLERYLSRLASMRQIPQALGVLRKELDRNPGDPGLYERLAQFLAQNSLGEKQEEVYRQAIQKFPDRSWYHKLARFYLRQRRSAEYARLSEEVIKIFSGTELESYFAEASSPQEYETRLNEFAQARFPHDMYFVRNLLRIYQNPRTAQPAKWEALLRQHWWESAELRDQFIEFLSRTGQLDKELDALRTQEVAAQQGRWNDLASSNPLAARFVGEADCWRSHFEAAAPVLGALTAQYPSDAELGRRASALYRSLAPVDPQNTELAVKIEQNLYDSNPGDRETLARIGDIYADRELFARAAPYWTRMSTVRPGEAVAYLDAATIYWDYFDFDTALKVIRDGRSRLGDSTLFAYEAGAIYEGKREPAQAIAEYLQGALKQHPGSRPYNRLLDLARRKKLRDEVERASAELTESATPSIDAIKLRVAILDAEGRPKDVEPLLASISRGSTSLETLEWLEQIAHQRSLVRLEEAALEKQAEVTSDPVRKLDLRYSLVRFYEAKKDLPQAQRNVDALYSENPQILGVVRATVNFYWSNHQPQRAVEVLLQAAGGAYPTLAAQLRFEAARKASESGQHEQARTLLSQLLAGSPFNEEYLAAMAEAYGRVGDDQGLKKFSLEKIEELRTAQLPTEQRTRQIAALRRGLVPALTRLKDYAGAVDQYIEVINRYPEDDALLAEAALYAQSHGRQQQLLGYYANTIQQSPRDYRWPMVLAKMQSQMEDYEAAVATYAAALNIRPERVDLRSARAGLLERLSRFDEAAAEYRKLFELNYHDAHWLEKVAELRARKGRTQEAVAALQTALVENRPEKPSNFFEAARRLEGWGMLQPALQFAQKGVDASGRDLLAVSENHSGAQLYVEIMTRLRKQEEAYKRLEQANEDAASLGAMVAVAVDQVEKKGIVSVTDQQWRDRALSARRQTATTGIQAAMQSMGSAVAVYFTPEEKQQFATWLMGQAVKGGNDQLATRFLPAATAAALPELQAPWLRQLMLSSYSDNAPNYLAQLSQLQTRRMHSQELGEALEEYSTNRHANQRQNDLRLAAAAVYRQGALYDAEFNVLKKMEPYEGGARQRYFELLLQRDTPGLVQIASSGDETIRDEAAQYAVAHGSLEVAQAAVAARGHSQPPVWNSAYAALTGLYFSDRNTAVKTAFVNALGDQIIGERIGKAQDRDRQLAGSTWFYYGSRYGEWIDLAHAGDPEDFLPAQLEQSPASASGYISVAEHYADAGKLELAIDDYNRTLELAPERADIHDRIAVLYWREKKKEEAVAAWKRSLELLDAQVHRRAVPSGFWSTFEYVMNHLGNRHLAVELRPQWEPVLRDYVRQNGTYESFSLLHAAYTASGDAQAGVSLLLDMASIAPEPADILQEFVNVDWIPAKARDPFFEQIIVRKQEHLRSEQGIEKEYAESNLRSWQERFALHLVHQGEFDRAAAVLQPQARPDALELEVRYRIALARSEFNSIFENYAATPETAPRAQLLRKVADALKASGERAAARKILEFSFTQEIAAHQLSSANMLGLAEIRLQDGDAAGAMELLRRLVLVVGEPFENLAPAANLLAKNGRHAEAAEFLARLVKAKPWDTDARLHLAQEQIAAGEAAEAALKLAASLASDSQAAYSNRLAAAAVLSGSGPSLGSGELDYLAYGSGSPDRPYFYAARLSAAKKASDPELSTRLLMNALADAPDNDASRAPLLHVLAQLKRDRLALLSFEPLLHRDYFVTSYTPSVREEDIEEAPDETAAQTSPDDTQPKPAAPALSDNERAELAVLVAGCYSNLDDLKNALNYYQSALNLQKEAVARAAIMKSIELVRARVRREATNALRMPKIGSGLDQPHVVRPRLVAARSAPAKPAPGNKDGGAQ